MKRAAALACAALGAAQAAWPQPTLDEAALERWLDGYEAAWEMRDASSAAALFSEDAEYYETPFAEPFVGREGIGAYWSDVTADQRDIDFRSEAIAVEGDVGVARWTATFTSVQSGAPVELDGVFVLEFDAEGLCTELREWWFVRPTATQ